MNNLVIIGNKQSKTRAKAKELVYKYYLMKLINNG